jgi:AcrR family transcriptional regulator
MLALRQLEIPSSIPYTHRYVTCPPVSEVVDAAPLSREARKAQTRQAIIDAATQLFAAQGIESTSLDRIASEVGLTKGAIYSTFASKDELVEAVAVATSVSIEAKYLADPEVPLREGLRRVGAELIAARKKFVPNEFILHLEITLYERRHRSWGKRVLEEQRAAFDEFAKELEAAVKARGDLLPTNVINFAYGLRALAQGIVQELERDPKTFTKESIMDLFEALAD